MNAALESTQVRGALLLQGSYRDIADFDPLIARPLTDTAQAEPAFEHSGWFPSRLAAVNRVEAAGETLERLVAVPGQLADDGRQRLWDRLTFEVFYSNAQDTTYPTIWEVGGWQAPESAGMFVDVSDNEGIERVLVAYDLGDGQLRSVDLSRDGQTNHWQTIVPLAAGQHVAEFFAQAVDRSGNVSTSTNKGQLFRLRLSLKGSALYLPFVSGVQ